MLNPNTGQGVGPGRADGVGSVMDPPPAPAVTAASGHARPAFALRRIVGGLAWDVGLPLVVYFLTYLAGADDWLALLAASIAAAVRTGWVAVRTRTLNPFALMLLGVFGLALILAFVSGEPRYLLLQSSVLTATTGILLLSSAAWGRRPLTLAAEQHWNPQDAAEIAEEYRSDPDVRHGHRVSSTVWGLGLLAEAVMRIPLVFLLPISAAVVLSSALTVAVLGGLIIWNIRYATHADAQRRDGAAGETP